MRSPRLCTVLERDRWHLAWRLPEQPRPEMVIVSCGLRIEPEDWDEGVAFLAQGTGRCPLCDQMAAVLFTRDGWSHGG